MELWDEVSAWLAGHWDPDLTVDEWWRLVADAGWAAPHLSVEHGGRGLHRRAQATVHAAFAAVGALKPPTGLGLLMAAPTIVAHGTDEQIVRHVRPILDGQQAWCQLFSEPGAGSDLAGLTTRAERDGDRWVITGQKVWSSQAVEADYGMLLARTDPSAPKHAGITWFALPLDQPGVDIRPLREMTGRAVFNEVFLDEVICDGRDVIGGENNGWHVAQTTLSSERSGIGGGGGGGFTRSGRKGGMLGRRAGDAAHDAPPSGTAVLSVQEVIALARSCGRDRDPVLRQKLARLYAFGQVGGWNALRARAEATRGGGQGVANLSKLAHARLVKLSAQIALEVLGAGGMLADGDGVQAGRFTEAMVFSPASSIYGGTNEIQHNIIGERVLGLPREPKPG